MRGYNRSALATLLALWKTELKELRRTGAPQQRIDDLDLRISSVEEALSRQGEVYA